MAEREYHVKFKGEDGEEVDGTFRKKWVAMSFADTLGNAGMIISHDIYDEPAAELPYIERMLASEIFRDEYPMSLGVEILKLIDWASEKMEYDYINRITSLEIRPFKDRKGEMHYGFKMTTDDDRPEYMRLGSSLHE